MAKLAVAECPQCKGFGCNPPGEHCENCNGKGLVKVQYLDRDEQRVMSGALRRSVKLK
jgi:DnaJ-class molecular chaperone